MGDPESNAGPANLWDDLREHPKQIKHAGKYQCPVPIHKLVEPKKVEVITSVDPAKLESVLSWLVDQVTTKHEDDLNRLKQQMQDMEDRINMDARAGDQNIDMRVDSEISQVEERMNADREEAAKQYAKLDSMDWNEVLKLQKQFLDMHNEVTRHASVVSSVQHNSDFIGDKQLQDSQRVDDSLKDLHSLYADSADDVRRLGARLDKLEKTLAGVREQLQAQQGLALLPPPAPAPAPDAKAWDEGIESPRGGPSADVLVGELQKQLAFKAEKLDVRELQVAARELDEAVKALRGDVEGSTVAAELHGLEAIIEELRSDLQSAKQEQVLLKDMCEKAQAAASKQEQKQVGHGRVGTTDELRSMGDRRKSQMFQAAAHKVANQNQSHPPVPPELVRKIEDLDKKLESKVGNAELKKELDTLWKGVGGMKGEKTSGQLEQHVEELANVVGEFQLKSLKQDEGIADLKASMRSFQKHLQPLETSLEEKASKTDVDAMDLRLMSLLSLPPGTKAEQVAGEVSEAIKRAIGDKVDRSEMDEIGADMERVRTSIGEAATTIQALQKDSNSPFKRVERDMQALQSYCEGALVSLGRKIDAKIGREEVDSMLGKIKADTALAKLSSAGSAASPPGADLVPPQTAAATTDHFNSQQATTAARAQDKGQRPAARASGKGMMGVLRAESRDGKRGGPGAPAGPPEPALVPTASAAAVAHLQELYQSLSEQMSRLQKAAARQDDMVRAEERLDKLTAKSVGSSLSQANLQNQQNARITRVEATVQSFLEETLAQMSGTATREDIENAELDVVQRTREAVAADLDVVATAVVKLVGLEGVSLDPDRPDNRNLSTLGGKAEGTEKRLGRVAEVGQLLRKQKVAPKGDLFRLRELERGLQHLQQRLLDMGEGLRQKADVGDLRRLLKWMREHVQVPGASFDPLAAPPPPNDQSMLTSRPLNGYKCLSCDRPIDKLQATARERVPSLERMEARTRHSTPGALNPAQAMDIADMFPPGVLGSQLHPTAWDLPDDSRGHSPTAGTMEAPSSRGHTPPTSYVHPVNGPVPSPPRTPPSRRPPAGAVHARNPEMFIDAIGTRIDLSQLPDINRKIETR